MEWHLCGPERLPDVPKARAQAQDLEARSERPGLQPRDREELADHPGEPLRLLGDDRETSIGPLLLELLGVGADAGQRRLEVVADAAQEVVLRGVQLHEP